MKNKKSFIPKKKNFFGRSQYQYKKALFTDSIFREGFGNAYVQTSNILYLRFDAFLSLSHVHLSAVALLENEKKNHFNARI